MSKTVSPTATKDFGIKRSTFIAILLSIVTGGFYFYYWMVRITLKLNKHFKTEVLPVIYLFLILICIAWGDYHTELSGLSPYELAQIDSTTRAVYIKHI